MNKSAELVSLLSFTGELRCRGRRATKHWGLHSLEDTLLLTSPFQPYVSNLRWTSCSESSCKSCQRSQAWLGTLVDTLVRTTGAWLTENTVARWQFFPIFFFSFHLHFLFTYSSQPPHKHTGTEKAFLCSDGMPSGLHQHESASLSHHHTGIKELACLHRDVSCSTRWKWMLCYLITVCASCRPDSSPKIQPLRVILLRMKAPKNDFIVVVGGEFSRRGQTLEQKSNGSRTASV